MATTISFDKETGLATISISGELDLLQAIKAASAEMLKHPDFRPGADALWDLRQAELKNLPTNDIQALVTYTKGYRQDRGSGYKVAIVVERDLLFGGARMFEAFCDTVPFTCSVFRAMDEAVAWLGRKI